MLAGFGFIIPDDLTDGDLFVHVSDVLESAELERGQRVTFTLGTYVKRGTGPPSERTKLKAVGVRAART